MSLVTIRRLRAVKRLRAERAEQEQRCAQARFVQAEAAVTAARQVLAEWVEEMPCRSAAIYDAAIGRDLDRDGLEDLRRRVVALSEHRRVLEHRVAEAAAAARKAHEAVRAAAAALAAARRAVGKFDELVEVLQRADRLEADRREDAELEEAAERNARASEEDGDDPAWAA